MAVGSNRWLGGAVSRLPRIRLQVTTGDAAKTLNEMLLPALDLCAGPE
jgi:HAMP domain-containing protein